MSHTENHNIFYPAIAVRDKDVTFGEGRRCGTTMQDLAQVIMETEGLSQLPAFDKIDILRFGLSRPVVRLNRVIVGVLLWAPEDYRDNFLTTGVEPTLQKEIEEPKVAPQLSGQSWYNALTEYAAKIQDPDLFAIIDSMPEDFSKVGDTHVIVPNSENMTDDMIDATRGLLLHFDTNQSHNAADIRKSLGRHHWTMENLPEWLDDDSHVTKAGRAILAHHLTIAAYTNPPKEGEKYFNTPKREDSFEWGVSLILRHREDEINIGLRFSDLCKTEGPIADGQAVDFMINRHELPEEWRAFFKKQAIVIKGTIRTCDGAMALCDHSVTMGLKAQVAESVAARLDHSVKLPTNPIRS